MNKRWVERLIKHIKQLKPLKCWLVWALMSVASVLPTPVVAETSAAETSAAEPSVAETGASADVIPVAPPKGAVLLDEVVSETGEFQVMLAPIKRLIGEMQTDRSQWVTGQRTFGTWEWSRKGTLESAIRHFDKRISGQDVIFRCTGRDCGANQLWANEVFNVARLVGRDSKQFYLVAKRTIPNSQTVAFDLVYGVQRNRHLIMIHVERVAGELLQ